jgi:hypothetical protein
MKVSVFTCTPQFENDLMDAVRIFIGSAETLSQEEGGDMTLRHTEEVTGNTRICRVDITGQYSGSATRQEEILSDSLLDKRMHKRQLKNCAYEVMKRPPPSIRPGAP